MQDGQPTGGISAADPPDPHLSFDSVCSVFLLNNPSPAQKPYESTPDVSSVRRAVGSPAIPTCSYYPCR